MKRIFPAAVISVLLPVAVLAVTPVTTTHRTEADFTAAESDGVVVWSLGEVTLGAATETILADQAGVDAITAAAADDDGTLYVGTAAEGRILRIAADGTATTLADLDSAMVTDLVLDGARLLASTAGGPAGVVAIDINSGDVTDLFSHDDVSAVWDIALAGRDTLLAATGSTGKLFAIGADGHAEVIFAADQQVLRSLVATEQVAYVGTGEDGLVYRIDLTKTNHPSRVVLDAAEAEIVSLVVDWGGTLYAAATDVTTATPTPPADRDGGRPAVETTVPQTAPEPTPATQPAAGKDPDEGDGDGTSDGETAPAPQEQAAGTASGQPTTAPAEAMSVLARRAADGGEGNTVYRIARSGLVKVVGKVPETIFTMAYVDRPTPALLVGIDGGRVRAIDLMTGATGALAEIDPEKVTALAATADGTVMAGTTAPATVLKMTTVPAAEGTFLSRPIDAGQIARWGTVSIVANLPEGTGATVAVRTGNMAEPDERTWSDWSADLPATMGWTALDVPAGRFAQYRLTLTGRMATVPAALPVIDSVSLVHQVGNLPPQIDAVTVEASDNAQKSATGEGPLRYRLVGIEADDPNGDALRFDLDYRPRGGGVWIRWAKDLSSPKAAWDTRGVADGAYDLRALATDAPGNPPETALRDKRLSRAVIVDNTPPRIDAVAVATVADGVRLTGTFADANRIDSVRYQLSGADLPVVVAAADGIFDAASESIDVVIDDIEPGTHAITLEIRDEFGNTAHKTLTVTVEPSTGRAGRMSI
ncbi:MAG: hypothetical protein ACOC7R_02550 [Planctomycetota bacterium]